MDEDLKGMTIPQLEAHVKVKGVIYSDLSNEGVKTFKLKKKPKVKIRWMGIQNYRQFLELCVSIIELDE